MKERPLLMAGSMVRPTLADVKTNTRRTSGLEKINAEPDAFAGADHHGDSMWCFRRKAPRGDEEGRLVRCPYGVVGDRLWVRETHAQFAVGDSTGSAPQCVAYRATCDEDGGFDYVNGVGEVMRIKVTKWTPSIHMPRWASRLTLEITGIRVERLCSIGEADARTEGIDFDFPNSVSINWKGAFARLWDSINGDGAWLLNPHVWVLAFKRVKP